MRKIDGVLALGATQAGVVSRQQCLDLGLTRQGIETWLTTRRWQRVHRGVYATYAGPLTDDSRVWAAVLAVGEHAVVSHRAALWLGHRQGKLPLPIDVAVPVAEAARPVSGVRVHQVARLKTASGSPPRMTVESALLETVHLETDVQEVVSLVCQLVGRRETRPWWILHELRERPRQRWRKQLEAVLAEVEVGAQSPLELLDLRNDRAHGLPKGRRQVFVKAGGEGRRLDVLVVLAGVAVVKELDGRLGHEGTGAFRDAQRDNAAALGGGTALRFGWTNLFEDRCEVAAIQALLWRRRTGLLDIGHGCRNASCDFEARVARLAAQHPLLAP